MFMKLLTVKDEVKNVTVMDNRYDENAIHFLNEKTDKVARAVAKKYLGGRGDNIHLKRMKNDNAYLIYEDTSIKYGNEAQSQGVLLQFDLLESRVCDVNFITADTKKIANITSCLSFDLHKTHYTEENVESLKKDEIFYAPDMVKMFKELGEEHEIKDIDSDVFYKNQYLLLEKGRLQTGVLFDLYRDIKDLTKDPNAQMSKTGRCVTFALNGQLKRVNVLGGTMPEMNGYIYFTKERMLAHIKNVMNGKITPPPAFYNGVELELGKYSVSKNLEDMIDKRFKDNYLMSLIRYNEEINATKTDSAKGDDEAER